MVPKLAILNIYLLAFADKRIIWRNWSAWLVVRIMSKLMVGSALVMTVLENARGGISQIGPQLNEELYLDNVTPSIYIMIIRLPSIAIWI